MFLDFVNLGGVSPTGRRSRLRNPVRKVAGGMGGARLATGFFQRGAAPAGVTPHGGGGGGGGGGGKHWHGGGGGGFWPYYGINYPYYYPSYGYYPYLYPYAYSPSYYGYGYGYTAPQQYTETVPSSCCYNTETGSLYCPGSEYDGAPAYAEATRQYQGRSMSYVTSPKLGQAQWFWNCPTEAEPSAILGGGPPPRMQMPRYPNRPGPRRNRLR